LTDATAPNPAAADDDIAALAKGGRTNVFGFLLRLAARIPFLFIAGRLYGPEALGRFAYAILIIELVAQLATMGLRRGLAELLAKDDRPASYIVADGLILAIIASTIGGAFLIAVPQLMFPNSAINGLDRFLPVMIIAIVTTEIALAALAYRFDIASAVRARAVIEPWTISIGAGAFYFYSARDGLILAYVASLAAGMVASLWPLWRNYGWPSGWRPDMLRLNQVARRNLPLAAADAAEWGSRRLDLVILGLFASPAVVGVYYAAQQVASLPQKLKTSFDPILGPVITRNLADGQYTEIAKQIGQVGFWIIAAQAGVALALGIPGESVMGLLGPQFVGGTGAMILLLAAEVAASTAVVSESALVYLARHRNLMISLGMLVVEAILCLVLIEAVELLALEPRARGLYQAAAVALALTLALALASVVKVRLLQHLLQAKVNIWRSALLLAVAAAVLVGFGVSYLNGWLQLAIGIPAILGAYSWMIWTRGFGDEDRKLFRKSPESASS
jgi:O-antigen/teichoic acid export membrane protein